MFQCDSKFLFDILQLRLPSNHTNIYNYPWHYFYVTSIVPTTLMSFTNTFIQSSYHKLQVLQEKTRADSQCIRNYYETVMTIFIATNIAHIHCTCIVYQHNVLVEIFAWTSSALPKPSTAVIVTPLVLSTEALVRLLSLQRTVPMSCTSSRIVQLASHRGGLQ